MSQSGKILLPECILLRKSWKTASAGPDGILSAELKASDPLLAAAIMNGVILAGKPPRLSEKSDGNNTESQDTGEPSGV